MSLLTLLLPYWTPSQLLSIRGWWKADELSGVQDANVASWSDASGAGNTASTDGFGIDPQIHYGARDNKVVKFTAANADRLRLPNGAVSAFTQGSIFYVAKANADNTQMATPIGGFGTGGGGGERYNTAGTVTNAFLTDTTKTIADPGDISAWHLMSFHSAASDWRAYFNAVSAHSTGTNTVAGATGQPMIGAELPVAATFDGYVAEVVLFNSVLTTAERERVEGYLAWKWGLQASLPGAHTYAAAPPMAPSPISGTSALTFTATGVVTGAGALAGASASAFTTAGILRGAGGLSGVSTAAFVTAGALTGAGALSGASTVAFAPAGSLAATGALSGASAVSFVNAGSLSAVGALVGQTAVTFSSAGNVVAIGGGLVTLSGSTSLNFVLTGSLVDLPWFVRIPNPDDTALILSPDIPPVTMIRLLKPASTTLEPEEEPPLVALG